MFAVPRPKKSILPPPTKKRKTTSNIEEISFDNDARQEYLTGFHKRKQQRIKNAQEEAAKRAHQEKLDTRKQLREDRRREAEEHVQQVNRMLKESGAAGQISSDSEDENADVEFEGFPDCPDLTVIDHEEQYIDEDRYTTVTVESVAISRDGLSKPDLGQSDDEAENRDQANDEQGSKRSNHPPKKKKKKFRYESKIERQLEGRKQKAKKIRR